MPTPLPTPSLLTKVGDVVTFGNYEQDNNLANGKEQISWRVLAVSGGKALLISDKTLDSKPYNTTQPGVTWDTCSLRNWLNADFIGTAFSASEKAIIFPTEIITYDFYSEPTVYVATTYDKLFLLSNEDVDHFFSTKESRVALNTPYAKAQGAGDFLGNGCWWLRTTGMYRSPGTYHYYAMYVYDNGDMDVSVGTAEDCLGNAVRPAMWVNLGS